MEWTFNNSNLIMTCGCLKLLVVLYLLQENYIAPPAWPLNAKALSPLWECSIDFFSMLWTSLRIHPYLLQFRFTTGIPNGQLDQEESPSSICTILCFKMARCLINREIIQQINFSIPNSL